MLEEVAATHRGPIAPANWEHNDKRRLIRIVPPVPGLWTCFIHTNCVCNEIVSATNRVLGVVPLPTAGGLRDIRVEMKRLAAICGHLVPWDLERVLASFTGARYRNYAEAYESFSRVPLNADDARIDSFVKAEKTNPLAKTNPDPRMIQARSRRYNLQIAKYLRPVEHFIYNLPAKSGLRSVAKGLNQLQRAALFLEKWGRFKRPVCFSLDCSRWDKHVSMDVLRVEHAFYRRVLPGYPEFDRLLSWQEVNKCRTSGGVRYEVWGGRMSGDINTALGNCLLMVIMANAAIRRLGIEAEILDDGDDCLLIVEEENFDLCQAELPGLYLSYGQTLKIENIARDIHDVVFCQSHIVHNGLHFLFSRNWRKVLSQSCCGTRHWNVPTMVRPMMGLIGRCELALNAGIPILQAFSEALIRMSRGKEAPMVNLDSGLAYRIRIEQEQVQSSRAITTIARYAFERTYGVPIWEQEAIEQLLANWELDDECAIDVPPEWSADWTDTRSLAVMIPEIY